MNATAPKIARCPQCHDDILVGWVDCLHCGFILPQAVFTKTPPADASPREGTPMPNPIPPAGTVPATAGPGFYYYPQQPAPQYVVQSAKTNGLAVAALVLGIIWGYWIGSVLALIFGYTAKKQIADSGGTQQGGGLATAGIVLGWIGVGTFALFIVLIMIAAAGS